MKKRLLAAKTLKEKLPEIKRLAKKTLMPDESITKEPVVLIGYRSATVTLGEKLEGNPEGDLMEKLKNVYDMLMSTREKRMMQQAVRFEIKIVLKLHCY